MEKPRRDDHLASRHGLSAVLAAIVLSFIAATAFVHWHMRAIDRAARDIADNAAPSIEHLTAARVEIRHLQTLLREELEQRQRGEAIDRTAFEESHRILNSSVDAYLALPLLPEERELWSHVFRGRAALAEVRARFEREVARGDLPGAAITLREQVPAVTADLNDALTQSVQADARHAADFAREIQDFRARAAYLAVGLDLLCTVIAILGAVAIRRLLRRHTGLLERHRVMQEERASELEDFAGRIAHDILSPLGTVAFALQLAGNRRDEQQRQRLLARGIAAVERIKKLVHGLLDFARAGGKPADGARADLDATIADLVAELEPAAVEAGAELTADGDRRHVVACNPGVLTSLLANLARNAIKYLGDGPVRHVAIRAQERGGSVRVEVADTGPGLPPEIEKRVFQPYVRAPGATQPGVGLGLATVKRLAEAHGGRVGVQNKPGVGCTFWFELPKAEVAVPTSGASTA